MNDGLNTKIALAVIHLSLVAYGASSLHLFPRGGIVYKAIQTYGNLSGSNSTYGYFAPSVLPSVRMQVTVSGGPDKPYTYKLRSNKVKTHEILYTFNEAYGNPNFTIPFAQRMFANHPERTNLDVRFDIYQVPTMEEYRAGARPRWETVYDESFSREQFEHDPGSGPAD